MNSVFRKLCHSIPFHWRKKQRKRETKHATISKVFSNHVILQGIFRHLRLQDLLKCRLVSDQWNSISTSVIVQKNMWTITLTISCNYALINKGRKLARFTKRMMSSKIFPCTSLKLNMHLNSGLHELYYYLLSQNLPSVQVFQSNSYTIPNHAFFDFVQFLKVFGSEIKFARIKIYRHKADLYIPHMILHELPNLEFLKLTDDDTCFQTARQISHVDTSTSTSTSTGTKEEENFRERIYMRAHAPLQLSNLKCFEYQDSECVGRHDSPSPLFIWLLNASPNLAGIFNFELGMLDCLESAGKMKEVKDCNINFWDFVKYDCNPVSLSHLKRFSNFHLNLEILYIGEHNFEISAEAEDCISRILHSCQASLKRLTTPAFRFIPGVSLPPVFLKLEYICIDNIPPPMSELNNWEIFPQGYLLGVEFPFPVVSHVKLITSIYSGSGSDIQKPGYDSIYGTIVMQILNKFSSLKYFELHSSKFDESLYRTVESNCSF